MADSTPARPNIVLISFFGAWLLLLNFFAFLRLGWWEVSGRMPSILVVGLSILMALNQIWIPPTPLTRSKWLSMEVGAHDSFTQAVSHTDPSLAQDFSNLTGYPIAASDIALYKKDWQQAKVFWERALSLQPTHRDILWNLAVISNVLGQQQDAVRYRSAAERVDPNHEFPQSPSEVVTGTNISY